MKRIEKRVEQGLYVRVVGSSFARELRIKGLKYCPKCRRILELSEFSTMKVGSKTASHCRECSNESGRELSSTDVAKNKSHEGYERDKSKMRERALRRKFGIGLNDYNKMLAEQKSKCAICGITQEDNGKALAVDHNHATGKVRGLLCNNCNAATGFLQDKPWIAIEIHRYLLKEA